MLDFIQRIFHRSRKFDVDDFREPFVEQPGGGHAQLGGHQLLGGTLDVFTLDDRGNDRGIGARAAHAVFFQRFDERSLGVAGRRLREMLGGHELLELELFAAFQLGQLRVPALLRVAAFFIQRGKAFKFHLVAVCGKHAVFVVARSGGGDLGLDGVLHAIRHQARHEAQPDEIVKLKLFRRQAVLDHGGGQLRVGGAHGLVPVLRVGALLEIARLIGQEFVAVGGTDIVAALLSRLIGNAQGVRSHIGDQTHGAVSFDRDALIQLLRDLHRAGGLEVQPARSLLLHGGGGEGRRRAFFARTLFDGTDRVFRPVQPGDVAVGLVFVFQLDFAVFIADKVGGEHTARRRNQLGVERPVLLRYEVVDLIFLVDNQPHRHALHPAGGKPAADLLADKGAELVADQTVENAARLLGWPCRSRCPCG